MTDTERPPRTLAENLLVIAKAVEQLAREHIIRTRFAEGSAVVIASVAHRPLIEQLRGAVYGSSGSESGGGGTEARTRSVINPAALEKMQTLRDNIFYAWAQLIPGMESMPTTWGEETALQMWADLFIPLASAGGVDESTVAIAAQTFAWWRHTITQESMPSRIITSQHPCPVCGYRWTIVEDSRVRAIQIVIAADPDRHRASCRNTQCGHTWTGQEELESLAKDQRDRATLGIPDSDGHENSGDTALDRGVVNVAH